MNPGWAAAAAAGLPHALASGANAVLAATTPTTWRAVVTVTAATAASLINEWGLWSKNPNHDFFRLRAGLCLTGGGGVGRGGGGVWDPKFLCAKNCLTRISEFVTFVFSHDGHFGVEGGGPGGGGGGGLLLPGKKN